MPQIRCPNCGLTISLENRKESDNDLITDAVQHGSKTFTDLLHTTKLPRKTLYIRLKELCENGTIVKAAGVYALNGHPATVGSWSASANRFSRLLRDKRIRTGLVMMALVISVPAFSFALARVYTLPSYHEPVFVGSFKMVLEVHNMNDVYAWQVATAYNASELKVLGVQAGDFVAHKEFPSFVNTTDTRDDDGSILLLASTLLGSEPGRSGSGELATITFGYFSESYETPTIAPQWNRMETCWISSEGVVGHFEIGSTITLTPVE